MKNYVKEFLSNRKNIKLNENGFVLRFLYQCDDGTELSIQASKYHYCSPRETNNDGDYESVEIRVQRKDAKQEWIMYAEDIDDAFALYGYIPVTEVNNFIKEHGGPVKEKE